MPSTPFYEKKFKRKREKKVYKLRLNEARNKTKSHERNKNQGDKHKLFYIFKRNFYIEKQN